MSGELGALSMAWVEAEAALPLGWRLMALVRQPDSDDWQATAAGPLDGQTVHGRGSHPDQALRLLADELRRIRGPVTGWARGYNRRRCHALPPPRQVVTDLHAVEVRNARWWFRGRLCSTCYRELERRRRLWMAHPQADPDSLRGVRLAAHLSVRELARRTGLSASMISQIERGVVKSWPRYVERLTAAIGSVPSP